MTPHERAHYRERLSMGSIYGDCLYCGQALYEHDDWRFHGFDKAHTACLERDEREQYWEEHDALETPASSGLVPLLLAPRPDVAPPASVGR